jgi:hypothetical protein
MAESRSPESRRDDPSLIALKSLPALLRRAALEAADRPPIKLGDVMDVMDVPSVEVKRLAEDDEPRCETLEEGGSTELTMRCDRRLTAGMGCVETRGLEAAEDGEDRVELVALSGIALASSRCSFADMSLTELLLLVRCLLATLAASSFESRADGRDGVPVRLRWPPFGSGGGLLGADLPPEALRVAGGRGEFPIPSSFRSASAVPPSCAAI